MVTMSLEDTEAGLFDLVADVTRGEFVTITRNGKPVVALVPIEVAEVARKAIKRRNSSLVAYLQTFPGGEFDRHDIRRDHRGDVD